MSRGPSATVLAVSPSRRTRPGRLLSAPLPVLGALIILVGCTSQKSNITATATTPSPSARSSSSSTAFPVENPSSTTVTSAASRRSTASSAPGAGCTHGHCFSVGEIRSLPVGVAPESSGIVASQKSVGVFFVVDDGTGTDRIVAVRSNGSSVGNVRVQGMSAGNAEALAAGPCGDRSGRCFYIGDIGDNNRRRDHITIYRIDEPEVSPLPSTPVASDEWEYTYPDGPHDAEALVVDTAGSLVVITKSAPDPGSGIVPPHRIYRGQPGGGQLRLVSSFTPPQPARRVQSLFTGNVVTDAALTPGRMLLLTYDQVIEYLAPTENADPATFPSWPHHELPDPPMIQTEGIAADITGCGYQVTSEEGPGGTRAGLAGVTCR